MILHRFYVVSGFAGWFRAVYRAMYHAPGDLIYTVHLVSIRPLVRWRVGWHHSITGKMSCFCKSPVLHRIEMPQRSWAPDLEIILLLYHLYWFVFQYAGSCIWLNRPSSTGRW